VSNGPFDLAGLLRGAVAAFRPLSDQHTLQLDLPDDLPGAHGDATATDIVVGQLLENAFKYSPDGGAVIVRAQTAGDVIEVTIADEGIGIRPEDRERVFERFVQGDAGDRRRFGGIGLGLYIVRQLAMAQGGQVTAEGREGGGTTMRLCLPLAAGQAAEPAGEQAANLDAAASAS
jgi:signal transduction histidine kinase